MLSRHIIKVVFCVCLLDRVYHFVCLSLSLFVCPSLSVSRSLSLSLIVYCTIVYTDDALCHFSTILVDD